MTDYIRGWFNTLNKEKRKTKKGGWGRGDGGNEEEQVMISLVVYVTNDRWVVNYSGLTLAVYWMVVQVEFGGQWLWMFYVSDDGL